MQYKLILLLCTICPILGFSQTYISSDSANKLIIMNGGDCDRRIFTRIETPPSLKISKQAFIDSISTYLKLNRTTTGDGTIKLRFLIDCHAQISKIQTIAGDSSDATALKSFVLDSSSLWLPGRQNNYIASSYVSLDMEFKNNSLVNIKISQ